MNQLAVYLENEVYPRLDRMSLFAELEPKERGEKIICRCPQCGKHEAFIFKDKYRLRCPRGNNCGYQVSLLQFAANTVNSPRGEDFVRGCRELCKLAGVPFPERKQTPQQAEEMARKLEFEHHLEQFLYACRVNPASTWQYLESRGFKSIPGQFGTVGSEAMEYARNHENVIFPKALSHKWDGRIVGPIRDKRARLVGLFARTTDPKEKEAKYLYSQNMPWKEIGVAGLERALQKNNSSIALVEGIMEPYFFEQYGFNHACSIGGTILTPERWELLHRFGVRKVVMFPDADDAGSKGLIQSLEHADAAGENCPEIFIFNSVEEFGGAKDPMDFVLMHGDAELFGIHFQHGAEHQYRWHARKFAEGLDLKTDAGITSYLERCIDWDSKFTDKRKCQKLLQFFWPEVQQQADIDIDGILEARENMRARTVRKLQGEAWQKAQLAASTAAREGDLVKARQIYRDLEDELTRIELRPKVEEIRTEAEEIDEHLEELKKWHGLECIGLEHKKLPTLDRSLLGLRGMGMVGGRSGTGKTVFLCQTALGVLQNHPDACVIFFSKEMTRKRMRERMWSHLAALPWKSMTMGDTGNPEYPFKEETFERREAALKEYKRLMDRIQIIDSKNMQNWNQNKMLEQVARHQNRTECEQVLVLVDYIDVIDLEGTEDLQERQLEKAQVKCMLEIRDHLPAENPLIVITETRKSNGKNIYEKLTIEDFAGSTRKAFSSDWSMVMNNFDDEELLEFFEWKEHATEPYAVIRDVPSEYEGKAKEGKRLAQKIRKFYEYQGIGYGTFDLVKARDGGTRSTWHYTNYFHQSRIIEGIH